jgi:hypothetical protein
MIYNARVSRHLAHLPLLAVVLLLPAACAHDLPGWKKASTPHFALYTDLSRRHYEGMLEHLEEVHAGLASSFFDASIPPQEVFLFSEGEFRELLGPIGGMYLGAPGGQGILVVYDGWDREQLDRIAAHEMAHGFVNATFRSTPMWFNEGFATYAESIMIREGKVWFGSVGVRPQASGGRLVPVIELFNAPGARFHGDWETRHYSTAWAVVHYLWHGENKGLRKRFDGFGAALAQIGRQPGGSARAWQQVYPEISLTDLDGRIRDHLNKAFAVPKSSMVGFALTHPPNPPLTLEPAQMSYVDKIRAELKKRRRSERLF